MTSITTLPRRPIGPAGALRTLLTVICLVQALPAAAQAAASSAFGESADLHVVPLLGDGIQVASGPLPQVSGSAPTPYAKSASAASASVSTILTGSLLATGLLNVNASSQAPGAVATQGGAVVDAVALALGHLAPLFTLDADVVSSSASIGGTCDSGLVAAGSADLANASAGGSLGLGLAIAAHPGPNTVLLNVAGVKVVLNEQLATGNGTASRGLTVSAVHVYLQNALLSGLGVLSGDVVIARSQASVDCSNLLPPPKLADLALSGSDAPDPVVTGGSLHYSLSVSNHGPDPVSDAVLTVSLPAGLSGASAAPSQGSCSGTPIVCHLGQVQAGQEAAVVVTATVSSGPGTLAAGATVTSGVADPDAGNNSVTFSTQVEQGGGTARSADLSLVKTASVKTLVSGSTLVYTLGVANQGPGDAENVVVTDPLPEGEVLKSAAPSQGSCRVGPPVSCSLGMVAAGGVAQVALTVTVTAPPGTMTNTAGVTSDMSDTSTANNTASVSTAVTAPPTTLDAAVCRIDASPAATLLIPYFAVDLDHPQGVDTVFSITNALPQPQLAHVVLWTDWAVPTLTFDLYLTGYDVESVDLRELIVGGKVPGTGAAVSHQGDISDPNVAFPGCGATTAKTLPLWLRRHLRAAHTGRRSASTGACAGSLQADASLAVGYVTIDTVRACTGATPADAGYFADGGRGIATDENALLGEYFLVDPSQNQMDSDLAVHLRADPEAFHGGRYTFYSRYSGGADNRQPLGQSYAVSYTDAAPFLDGTQVIVWRDTKSPDAATRSCGAEPAWMPLAQGGVLSFDSEENSTLMAADSRPFPLATQIVKVGDKKLTSPYHSGWLLLDLGHEATSLFGKRAQAWVTVRHRALGHFSGSNRAFRLDDLCSAQ